MMSSAIPVFRSQIVSIFSWPMRNEHNHASQLLLDILMSHLWLHTKYTRNQFQAVTCFHFVVNEMYITLENLGFHCNKNQNLFRIYYF